MEIHMNSANSVVRLSIKER